MKFLVVLPAILADCSAEASLPIAAPFLASAGLYHGGVAAPYAAAYNDASFAYGVPITALNARLTAGPVVNAPAVVAPAVHATYAAGPAVHATYAAAPLAAAHVGYGAAPVAYAAAPAVAAAPVAYAAAPAVAAAPIAGPVSSQYQAQDEFGNIAYGYNNINSAKQETGNAYGGVTGSYTYVDEAGPHTVNYIADDLGFRVAASNLPVAPVYSGIAPVGPVYTGVAPLPVADTPEVAAAKADFFAAYEAQAALTRKRRDIAPLAGLGYPGVGYAGLGYAGLGLGAGLGYSGFGYAGAVAAPVGAVAHAAPATAAREAVLTTIKLNPGHAVFYRVD